MGSRRDAPRFGKNSWKGRLMMSNPLIQLPATCSPPEPAALFRNALNARICGHFSRSYTTPRPGSEREHPQTTRGKPGEFVRRMFRVPASPVEAAR